MTANNKGVIVEFIKVDTQNASSVQPFAKLIWNETYKGIISQDQIDFMLDKMYSSEKILQEIEEGYVWELALIDQNLVGYIDYKLEADKRVYLSKIYLDPSIHKKGVGQLLLDQILEYAKKNHAVGVHLRVNKSNAKAIAFYERNDFQITSSDVFEIGEGYVMDDYIMQLNLLK